MNAITAVINAHREGRLARASIESLSKCAQHARAAGYRVEVLAILDRADETTRRAFVASGSLFDQIVETEHADLGEARNEAVRIASGEMIAFLDADDLWCRDWLTRAADYLNQHGTERVLHPAYNVYFGERYELFVHPKQTDPGFTYLALAYQNLWTALVAAPANVLRQVPYRRADWVHGFGYEDWTWNCEILEHRFEHACVDGTVHFIRTKRSGSLSSRLVTASSWRTPVDTFRQILRRQP